MINIITGSSLESDIFLDGSNISVKGVGPALGINNPYRPALVGEVVDLLKDRKNHITERIYFSSDNSKVYMERLDGGKTLMIDENAKLPPEDESAIREEYRKVTYQETTITTSSEITFDLVNGSAVIDLIEEDEYTNCVGIDKIRKFAKKPGITAKIDLSVKYSTKGGVIGCEDLVFKAFEYDEDSNLIPYDFTTDLDCGIRVEFINGVIRLISISEDIKEQIISNCVVSYGKLKD